MAAGAHKDLEQRTGGRRASQSGPQEEAVLASLSPEKRARVQAAMNGSAEPTMAKGQKEEQSRGGVSLPELTSPNKNLHERVSPPKKGASPHAKGTQGLLAAVKTIKATRKVTRKMKEARDPMDLARPKRRPKPALDPMIQMNKPREELALFLQMRGLRKEECGEYIERAVQKYNSLHPKKPYNPAPSPYLAHAKLSEGKGGAGVAKGRPGVQEEPLQPAGSNSAKPGEKDLSPHALRKKVAEYNRRFDRRKEKRRNKEEPAKEDTRETLLGQTHKKLEGQMKTLEALEKDLERQRQMIAMELECREKATLKLQANSRGMLGRARVRKKKEVAPRLAIVTLTPTLTPP